MGTSPTGVNWWYRANRRLAASKVGSKLYSQIAHHLDATALRWTNGRVAPGALLTGVPIILLTTTGAKSGQPRTVPLLGTPDGDNLILVASNWGGKKHPAWYYNLQANPQAHIMRRNVTRPYVARQVFGDEYKACWQKAVAIYPGYNVYKTRTHGREIPIMVLTPQP